ncbi:uncharacterized protein PRCAT00000015001 [Priceomyces carsonii]|uniref:uncharacterized protein n=1 Tax=Priceomyces carsonii TaxID=28549 RepID=UPI002EDA3F4A|nr:unnamed protein product [Priceomyces carsonii]
MNTAISTTYYKKESSILKDATGAEDAVKCEHVIPPINSHYLASVENLRARLPFDISIATVTLPPHEGILQKLESCSSAGFRMVEIMATDLEKVSAEDIYATCKKIGIQVSIYQPFRDLEGLDDSEFQKKLTEFESFLNTADILHTDLILLCATCRADTTNDRTIFIEQLRAASDVAAKKNKKIAFEALAWSSYINTLEAACEVVLEVNRDNFGICLDSYHIFSRNCSLKVLDEKMKNKVFFVQLCDAPLLKLSDLLFYSRNYRCLPMQGEYRNDLLIQKALELNYRGPLSIEVFNASFRKQDDGKSIADDAFRSLMLLQCSWMKILPRATVFKGVFLDKVETVTPNQLCNIGVLVSDKDQFTPRLKLFGYASNLTSISESASSGISKKLNLICKNRFEFNRLILYLRCVLGYNVLLNDESDVYNTFGLPLALTFGGQLDDLKLTLIVEVE